ncbi:MAG: VOC family protein [Candidatus Kapabacteria bacterium]|nr:VOC family protein [Candidatus Kapabacteria bacterium]
MKIKNLNLFTNELEKLQEFYSQILGLELFETNKSFFSIKIGFSVLKFSKRQKGISSKYHFAINIPPNKLADAKIWLEERVFLMLNPKNAEEIIFFPNWNAKSLFFYDTVGNIIEIISRQEIENSDKEGFTQDSLLNISEIGLPVNNVEECINILKNKIGLEKYKSGNEDFQAIGDFWGLFIVCNTNRNWFPTPFLAESHPFSCVVDHNNDEDSLIFNGKKLILGT